jgi:GAF domain-containing protein
MNDEEKLRRYAEVRLSLNSILASTPNEISRMATINCLLSEAFPHYFWTGFYLLDENNSKNLLVGPYQGSMGCLHIPFGKGVCGAVAETGQSMIVDDVHALDNHIACDSRSQSEIVVPVWRRANDLIGVFDVDSTQLSSFNEIDKANLEAIMQDMFYKI